MAGANQDSEGHDYISLATSNLKDYKRVKKHSKSYQIENFDPNGVGQQGRLFGLPFDWDTSEIVVIPVPWDVTTSFSDGTSLGPKAILEVSPQIDLFMPGIPDAWKIGLFMLPIDDIWVTKNRQARKMAGEYIAALEEGSDTLTQADIDRVTNKVNALSNELNQWIEDSAQRILQSNKIPVVLGGDHSSPFGLMQAISKNKQDFGVLQIDAHADLRPAYEGFEYSHASIMHNLMKLNSVTKLVQVGIRDYCEQEFEVMESDPRIVTYYDETLAKERFEGATWSAQVAQIIQSLPQDIYISLDIDGLEQQYCPSTGTPVPGGLTYHQLMYLLNQLMLSGKRILAFDLCEVSGANAAWDAIVGSRLLYNLANITAVTHGIVVDNEDAK